MKSVFQFDVPALRGKNAEEQRALREKAEKIDRKIWWFSRGYGACGAVAYLCSKPILQTMGMEAGMASKILVAVIVMTLFVCLNSWLFVNPLLNKALEKLEADSNRE